MHYEEITSVEDINAGADGKVQTVEDIVNFLKGWGDWLAAIITAVKNFFEQLKQGLENSKKNS